MPLQARSADPFLVYSAPESYGIVDNVIPPTQRQNLSQICKLLNQISVGRLFGPDQRYLIPMNEFIESSSQEFVRWIAARQSRSLPLAVGGFVLPRSHGASRISQ